MQIRFFVHHQGVKWGPLTFEDIEARLSQKELYPTDYVFVADRQEWIPILEFVLVYGPKTPVRTPTLQTVGSRGPQDDSLDLSRFKATLPMPSLCPDSHQPAFPPLPNVDLPQVKLLPDFPPPLQPPQRVQEPVLSEQDKQLIINELLQQLKPVVLESLKSEIPATVFKKPEPIRSPRVFKEKSVIQVDSTETLKAVIRPARAVRLEFMPLEIVQAGEVFDVIIKAYDEFNNLAQDFNGLVMLESNARVDGLGPIEFERGIGKRKVRALQAGQMEFSLRLISVGSSKPDSVVISHKVESPFPH